MAKNFRQRQIYCKLMSQWKIVCFLFIHTKGYSHQICPHRFGGIRFRIKRNLFCLFQFFEQSNKIESVNQNG